jgi:hypothetical protein
MEVILKLEVIFKEIIHTWLFITLIITVAIFFQSQAFHLEILYNLTRKEYGHFAAYTL